MSCLSFIKVVEQSESERMLDPVARSTSALSRAGRPGLTKSFSLSTPNVAGLMDTETAILDRIRDLEQQIACQQVAWIFMYNQISFHLFRRRFHLNKGRYRILPLAKTQAMKANLILTQQHRLQDPPWPTSPCLYPSMEILETRIAPEFNQSKCLGITEYVTKY